MLDYEPEIEERDRECADALREITEARDRENQTNELRMIREKSAPAGN